MQVKKFDTFIFLLTLRNLWHSISCTIPNFRLACFFAVSGRTMTTGQITMASYTKAIDVWMIICVLFTMFAFLQILVVLFFKASESPEKEDHGGEKNDQGGEKKSRIVKLVDIGSKIGFPCLFLFFNIIYWSVYCG